MTNSAPDCLIRRYDTAASLLARAGDWLLRAEAEHNLVLSIAGQLESGSHDYDAPILLATVEGPEGVTGCAYRTPPFKLGLTRMPAAAIPLLIEEVAALYPTIPAVMGPGDVALLFAERWSAKRGVTARPGMRMRIFQLDRVEPAADPAPGRMRPAMPADLGLATAWARGFVADVGQWAGSPDPLARRLIDEGRLFFWEGDDGTLVSMAAGMAETPNGIRVGFVYTPPTARGRGYASACVAALSQHYLDLGRQFCFLYTDLANPTSNAIYQRMGYRPVCDVEDYNFE
ncbi:MAG TPA: GNAT family N-acetyltransferase [Gemmatimonadales bacterium]|nr:GNAT family N-acetyltransferase [Gemmatimonadales bacterium]